jgi:hypothetical protein
MRCLPLVALCLVASCQTAGPPAGPPATTPAAACVPLASIGADKCPPSFAEAQADKTRFCTGSREPGFDAFISRGACRGALRYTRHLFDGGPRYCLYDAKTLALRGYRAVDSKAMLDVISCGVDKSDFNDDGCEGDTCASP